MATQFLTVQYDGSGLTPTPVVNYSKSPVDFGYVYGYNTDISLEGMYTGITGGYTGAIQYLTGVFGNQFKTLTVQDNLGATLYSWPNVTVDSLNLDTNPYFIGSFVRYSIRLRSYDFPSGVIDPSNEYSFSQNEDSTVSVNHKISARGVRGSAGAFDNAVNFVKLFSGKDPFTNCAPFLVPTGSGILASISENINRAEGVYAITEVYRYNTGAALPYIKNSSLEISEAIDSEYRAIDYNLKLQGSPILKNANAVITSLSGLNTLTDIQNEFGISTSGWVKTSYSANIDSGAALVDIKITYFSGANSTGFFDYEITCEKDHLAGLETWKLNGEFKCFGPMEFRKQQLANFRSMAGNGVEQFEPYISGLVTSSPLYANIHTAGKVFSSNLKVDIIDNPQLAYLKIDGTLNDGYEPEGLTELKYLWDVTPSRWVYEMLPSANIEGAYVVQDMQMKQQPRQKFSLMSKTFNQNFGYGLISGYMTNWINNYVTPGTDSNVTAFKTDETFTTGTYEVNLSNTWVGADSGISTGILALQSYGSMNDLTPLRISGYNFGY